MHWWSASISNVLWPDVARPSAIATAFVVLATPPFRLMSNRIGMGRPFYRAGQRPAHRIAGSRALVHPNLSICGMNKSWAQMPLRQGGSAAALVCDETVGSDDYAAARYQGAGRKRGQDKLLVA